MQKPTIIALDPATNTGCAIGAAGGTPRLSTMRMRANVAEPQIELFGRAVTWFEGLIALETPSALAIEEPFYTDKNSNHDVTTMLQGLFAVFTGVARSRGMAVLPVAVKTWRKHALGTSKFGSPKDAKAAALQMCQRLRWPAPDDNAADAAGIFIWAGATLAPYGVLDPRYLLASATGDGGVRYQGLTQDGRLEPR